MQCLTQDSSSKYSHVFSFFTEIFMGHCNIFSVIKPKMKTRKEKCSRLTLLKYNDGIGYNNL